MTLHTLHTLLYITLHLHYITLHDIHYIAYITHITLHYTTFTLHCITYITLEFPARVSSKSVQQERQARECFQECPAKRCCSLMTVRVISTKKKTSIFIFAFVSVYSALHKVTAFGFVGSIRFFFIYFILLWFFVVCVFLRLGFPFQRVFQGFCGVFVFLVPLGNKGIAKFYLFVFSLGLFCFLLVEEICSKKQVCSVVFVSPRVSCS